MRFYYSLLFITLNMTSLLLFYTSMAQEVSLIKVIPNGYTSGRFDAKYGTYGSVVDAAFRPYQERLEYLEQKIYGLTLIRRDDPVTVAELIYLLEHEVVALNQTIANLPHTGALASDHRMLLYGTVEAYSRLRVFSQHLFEDMVRYIDVKLPGPNGQQIREQLSNTRASVYQPNYRSDEELNDGERRARYQKRLDEFLSEGGSLEEIQVLSPELLKKESGIIRYEYVQMENGEIRITKGKAGHILLARGEPVKSAGQLLFVKSLLTGEISLTVVTNASGSFKPDLLSAKYLSLRLQKRLHLAPELIVTGKGEPLSSQAIKIYLKAVGTDAGALKDRIRKIESEGQKILAQPSIHHSCLELLRAS